MRTQDNSSSDRYPNVLLWYKYFVNILQKLKILKKDISFRGERWKSLRGREEKNDLFCFSSITSFQVFTFWSGYRQWFSEVVSDGVWHHYSTLEQSCNVLNYTNLSELVAKKETNRPVSIMSVLLTTCCLSSSLLQGKKWSFLILKDLKWREDLVKSYNRPGISVNGFNSLKVVEVYKLPDFVLFSQSGVNWFIHSFIQSPSIYWSTALGLTCYVGHKDERYLDLEL